jgi:hypothetical protein
VKGLVTQCEDIEGLRYEVIVADDGSTDKHLCLLNEELLNLEHVRYITREKNIGRACIRNFLVQQATYEWVLFVDSDLSIIREDYILSYIQLDSTFLVAYGSYEVGNENTTNLRYLYEKDAAPKHTMEQRKLHPYHHLHTANLMMKRTTALTYPFDERFKRYGFEDVLLGKRLQEHDVCIGQINNPLLFDHFETNDSYMEKTEEALQTLYTFRNELSGFSSLLTLNYHLRRWGLHYLILFIFQQKREKWRTILCGENPNLKLYMIYKLGYFISLF